MEDVEEPSSAHSFKCAVLTLKRIWGFVGLLPMEHSSGERENKSLLTVRKYRQLRSDLVESAWTAKRNDPAMALYFEEQIKRKDPKTLII